MKIIYEEIRDAQFVGGITQTSTQMSFVQFGLYGDTYGWKGNNRCQITNTSYWTGGNPTLPQEVLDYFKNVSKRIRLALRHPETGEIRQMSEVIDFSRPTYQNPAFFSGTNCGFVEEKLRSPYPNIGEGFFINRTWLGGGGYKADLNIVYLEEKLNDIPLCKLTSSQQQTISTNTALIISGGMTDADIGDVITSKVKINGHIITLKTATSEGKAISFEKEFTVKDNKLYDGTSYLMELKRNETYHAEVWAEDNQGGKSEVTMIKFDLLPNYAPILTLKTLDKKVMYEKDTLLIEGTGSDQDIGDALMIKYRIANSATRTLNAFMSDGKEFTFTKPLQLKEGRLHDGNTAITAKLEGDVTYKLEVWIEDDKGARSTIETRTFTVVPNRPPVMVITATPTGKDLIGNDKLTIKGTATDPDENKMWIDIQINKQAIQTIPVENDVWSFSFTVNDITEGENIITLTARDQYDATHTKQLRITRQVTSTPSLAQTMRYELDTPEAISNITMWVKHLAQTDIKAAASVVAKGAAETFKMMEKVDGISPTGAIETEFSYSPQLAGERATIKFTNPSGITMIMGGMSSAKG